MNLTCSSNKPLLQINSPVPLCVGEFMRKLEGNGPVERACERTCPGPRQSQSRSGRGLAQLVRNGSKNDQSCKSQCHHFLTYKETNAAGNNVPNLEHVRGWIWDRAASNRGQSALVASGASIASNRGQAASAASALSSVTTASQFWKKFGTCYRC